MASYKTYCQKQQPHNNVINIAVCNQLAYQSIKHAIEMNKKQTKAEGKMNAARSGPAVQIIQL